MQGEDMIAIERMASYASRLSVLWTSIKRKTSKTMYSVYRLVTLGICNAVQQSQQWKAGSGEADWCDLQLYTDWRACIRLVFSCQAERGLSR